jgi:hypothetical protein
VEKSACSSTVPTTRSLRCNWAFRRTPTRVRNEAKLTDSCCLGSRGQRWWSGYDAEACFQERYIEIDKPASSGSRSQRGVSRASCMVSGSSAEQSPYYAMYTSLDYRPLGHQNNALHIIL